MSLVQAIVTNLRNRPGELNRVCAALGNAQVNINGLSGYGTGDQSTVYLLVNEGTKARDALKKAKIEADVREVLSKHLPNRPGELARFTKQLADQGVNIRAVFGTTLPHATDAEIFFEVDEPNKAKPFFT